MRQLDRRIHFIRRIHIPSIAFLLVLLLAFVYAQRASPQESMVASFASPGTAPHFDSIRTTAGFGGLHSMAGHTFSTRSEMDGMNQKPRQFSASPGALPPGHAKSPSLGQRALRFEIIAVGAFPIMLLYTDLGFGIGRYAASGFDSRYAPWPFQNSSSLLPDDAERLLRIGVAAGISCAIAAFDLISRLREEAKSREIAELDSTAQAK